MNINQISAGVQHQIQYNDSQNISFTALKNVYAKGFKNQEDVTKIVEWFKKNKAVDDFIKENDVDLYLKSKRGGKKITFNMDILRYIENICYRPYRELTTKPFNIKSLNPKEVVDVLPKAREFGVKYEVKGKNPDDAMKQIEKYLDINTQDIYAENPNLNSHACSEICVQRVPHIAGDIYSAEVSMDSYMYGCHKMLQ